MSYEFNPFTGNLDKVGAGATTSPGGSDTQVQFNDGGSFGGDSGLTFDKTTGKLTVGGKTLTASAPIDFSQTWNNAGVTFTGLKFNVTDTASGASSLLIDLQVGGSSVLQLTKQGSLYVGSTSAHHQLSCSATNWSLGTVLSARANDGWTVGARIQSGSTYSWSSAANLTSEPDLRLYRDAANTLAQRNGTNVQESRVYATYTNATNYQRCSIKTGKTTLSNVSGATVTATGLIPAGALLIGVTSRVNTACGTATGYTVGTSGDPDLWGVASAVAAGTATGSANFTAAGASGLFTAATDVVVTPTGGNFDGTGVIELAVHYLLTDAD